MGIPILDRYLERFTLRLVDAHLGREVDYMTKWYLRLPDIALLGRWRGGHLRLHHFHQGEPEVDVFHDHEFHFTTFPFASYLQANINERTGHLDEEVVPGWRFTHRTHEGFHVVYGLWHKGNHGQGVFNRYRSFWTVVASQKPERDFSLVRFEHPDGLTYYEALDAAEDGFDPRPYWIRRTHDAKLKLDLSPVPLFSAEFIRLNPLRGPTMIFPLADEMPL